jgi:hypothetical protein
VGLIPLRPPKCLIGTGDIEAASRLPSGETSMIAESTRLPSLDLEVSNMLIFDPNCVILSEITANLDLEELKRNFSLVR